MSQIKSIHTECMGIFLNKTLKNVNFVKKSDSILRNIEVVIFILLCREITQLKILNSGRVEQYIKRKSFKFSLCTIIDV